MQFTAKVRYIRFSPYKLRPIADVIRGKDLNFVLAWLSTYRLKRVRPVKKVIESAVANAKNQRDIDSSNLFLKEIRVDQGPAYKYYKPGAMGRSQIRRKRFSHINIVLESKNKKTKISKQHKREEKRGTKS